jgi:hypothetical protein
MAPNPLDAPQAIAAVASVGAVGPPVVSAQPLGPPRLPSPPPPSVQSTMYQRADALASGRWAGQPSVDVMARQTAAGFREAGPLLNGLSGGGAEGIDLTPSARRVLHAQQMLLGTRAAGPLLITPPPGELPPVSSYPPPLVGPPTALRPRTRAPRPTPGFRAPLTACSSPRPMAPCSARNCGQEGQAAAVGLLRPSRSRLCASSRTASASRTLLAC